MFVSVTVVYNHSYNSCCSSSNEVWISFVQTSVYRITQYMNAKLSLQELTEMFGLQVKYVYESLQRRIH